MANQYTLIYKKGSSHEIRVEPANDKNSYFEQEYYDSLKLIKEIVKSQKEDGLSEDGCNNRIVITGQRGSGKTSFIRSLSKYLDQPKEVTYSYKKKKIGAIFYVLEMIDPSHFDKNNNILLTVVTKMFSKAKDLMDKTRNKDEVLGKREDLLKQFEKVFKSFESIKTEITSYTLESLNKKSEAEDLRKKMHGFVKAFLDFVNKVDEQIANDNKKFSRLVLLIDDIDMSVSYSFEMLEQIRKYLELDNLIIIMSANMTQLFNEIREHYSRAFQNTLTLLNNKNQDLYFYVEDQASKYLVKLFPTSRRINVERRIEQLLKTRLIIVKETKKEDTIGKTMESLKDGDLQNILLAMIWEKTRLIFTPKDLKQTLHPIIPSNLRDLSQFIDVLVSLKDVNKFNKKEKLFEDSDAYIRCKNNIRVFLKYFMNTWIPNHLSVEEERVFENIPLDITEVNKHLINSINVIGTQHKKRLMSREVELDMIERNAENVNIDRDIYTMVSPNDPKFVKANKISDIFNQPSNYSYGDLLLMIDKYETYFESEDTRKFTDAIKIYYSILMFETIFFESTDVIYAKEESINDHKLIPIQKLIGGTVYYPNYFEIITDKHFNQKGPSFDAKRAFYHKLPVDNKVGDGYPFYAVLYYGDIRPDRYDTKHIYDTTFDNDAKVDGINYVTFDILSILSNMLNPWHTYYRAGKYVQDTEKDEEDGSWKNKIEDWRNFCGIKNAKTEETNTYIPNSILPFYSVDMMLNYLKKSIEVSSIIDVYPSDTFKTYDTLKNNGRKIWFDQKTISENKNSFNNLLQDIDSNSKERIEPYINILYKSKSTLILNTYNNPTDTITIEYDTKKYLNDIISYLMNEYPEGQKERDSLIKELHKYSTPSEIFKHLVESLWDNKMTEICIRSDIQRNVRTEESVCKYYDKLWDTTENLLSIVKDAASIYSMIFDKAAKIFISAKHKDKTSTPDEDKNTQKNS